MQRLYSIASVLVLTTLAGSSWTWAGSIESEAEVRELAREVLNGRKAVVRLYIGWKADPKAYKTVVVPLDGLDVVFDALRQAAGGSVPMDATVVVVPDDQQDEAIIEVMDGCLFGEPYRADGRITLWPGRVPPIQLSPCMFQDALRQPIENAEVEVLLADTPYDHLAQVRLWIADAKLDKSGRLLSPKASASCRLCSFLFVVNHPDCGPVPAVLRSYPSEPGEDCLFFVGALPKDRWCVFLDALGQPMAGATVEVHDGWRLESVAQTHLGSVQLDGSGRLRPLYRRPLLEHCCFLVSDPNYGTAIVEPYDKTGVSIDEPVSSCIVPLTPVGTRADGRSLWGTVVDSNEKPVAGAIVRCMEVTIPGHNRLHAFFGRFSLSDKCVKVPTDSEGRFGMHLPLANADGSLGRPVPPDAKYEVVIETLPRLGLESFSGSLPAGQEHIITMQPIGAAPKNFTGMLVFTDGRRAVRDVEKLKLVTLSIRSLGSNSQLGYAPGGWLEQENLPFGTYSATAEWDGVLYVFGPVEVTADSPQTVVLAPSEIRPAERMYCGRVIHGVTGRPVARAVVMQMPLPDRRIIDALGEELEDQIVHLGPELATGEDVLRILEEQVGWPMARTGADGHYEIALPTGEQPDPMRRLVAIAKGFLGAEQQLRLVQPQIDEKGQQRTEWFEPDATGKISLPDMKLFPAGIVVIDPCIPRQSGPNRDRDVRFHYTTAHGDPTPWLKDFWMTPIANQGQSVFYKQRLPVNQLQSVYVPAGVTLTLVIQRQETASAPIMVENVRLTQGETLDLGRVEFARAIQVVVRVLDSQGQPLEGITVRCLAERIGYGFRQGVSDGEGRAHVHIPPNSQGQLIVDFFDRETRTNVREGISYQIADEDAGKEFVLSLSDEFLKGLLESR